MPWGTNQSKKSKFFKGIKDACVQAGFLPPPGQQKLLFRVAEITLGLKNQYYISLDLQEFSKKINETFKWYDQKYKDGRIIKSKHTEYVSSLFALIQSSGMGKTKLMKEYKKQQVVGQEKDIRMLLCRLPHSHKPDRCNGHYDALLKVPPNTKDGNEEEERSTYLSTGETTSRNICHISLVWSWQNKKSDLRPAAAPLAVSTTEGFYDCSLLT